MVLSVYAQRKKEEMEKMEGRTHQMQGEDDKAWIQRLCAVNAQRCRDDPRHHEMADAWQRDRDIRAAKREEEEKIRAQHAKEAQMTAALNKEKAQRNKHEKNGDIECYEDPGKPHDADWLRAEVAPLCPDFQPGVLRAGVGVLALRHGLDRLAEMKTMGRPVKEPYGLVMQIALMVHQGRFTWWADPTQIEIQERLIVPRGESPFERRMVKHDDGSWGMPDKRVQMHWPIKVPNADGWLPGTRPPSKETNMKLSDIGKFNPNYKEEAKAAEVVQATEAEPPPRKIVQPPLRHEAQKPAAQPPAETNPLLNGDPAVVRAYAGPPPSRAWCEQWLYKYLPEQRGVPLKARISQKCYGKALVDTLALERPDWTLSYRRECFAFMLDKYDGMTEADVEREAEVLAEQQRDYAKKLSEAYGPPAVSAPERRMREPGED